MLRQLIFAIILMLITYSAFSACQKPITSDKVMIFVDLNGNEMEYERMVEGACARGEALRVLPSNYKEVVRANNKLTTESSRSYRACSRNPSSKTCAQSIKEVERLTKQVNNLRNSSAMPSKQELKRLVGELDGKGLKVSNLTFSGHDGGGSFGGAIGNLTKEDVGSIFRDFPNQRSNVQSLMLLGCYTGVTAEIRDWRDKFPNAKLIAGYDGQGPLGDRLAGHTYIRDILQKEADIVKEADRAKLYKLLYSGIENINQLSAAVYVEPYCSDDNPASYYFRPQKRGDERFRPFDDAGCLKVVHKGASLRDQLMLYINGEKDIPVRTSGTELRSIYNFSRENSHCFSSDVQGVDLPLNSYYSESEQNPLSTPDQLMMLLFYHDMKVNFARYFKDDLEQMVKLIEEFDPRDLLQKMTEEKSEMLDFYEFNERLVQSINEGKEKAFLKNQMKDLRQEIENEIGDDRNLKRLIELTVFEEGALSAREMDFVNRTELPPELANKLQKKTDMYHMMKQQKVMVSQMDKDEYLNALAMTKSNLQVSLVAMEKQIQSVETLKQNLQTKFWVPTEENIKNKSRKEILENLTVINQLLGDAWSYGSDGPIGKLVVAKNNMEMILNYRDEVPFSWHELNEKPEAPARVKSLFQYTSESQYNPMGSDPEEDPQALEAGE